MFIKVKPVAQIEKERDICLLSEEMKEPSEDRPVGRTKSEDVFEQIVDSTLSERCMAARSLVALLVVKARMLQYVEAGGCSKGVRDPSSTPPCRNCKPTGDKTSTARPECRRVGRTLRCTFGLKSI